MVKRPNFVGRAAVATRRIAAFLLELRLVGENFARIGKIQYSREGMRGDGTGTFACGELGAGGSSAQPGILPRNARDGAEMTVLRGVGLEIDLGGRRPV